VISSRTTANRPRLLVTDRALFIADLQVQSISDSLYHI
jgi:hypothetical protein